MAIDVIEEATSESQRAEPKPSIAAAMAEIVHKSSRGIVEVRSRGRGVGAGIIWDPAGLVMTNQHVVEGVGGSPRVLLADGSSYTARLVSGNPALDLALLDVGTNGLPALPVGDSTKLRIGELVFALGHPWGQRGVVTAGVISGLGHVTGVRSRRTADYIRSDVSLAPGNSGGPLLNASGEVVGINSMIFGGDLSVAVPSHVAIDWLSHARKSAYLGVGVRPVRINTSRSQNEPLIGVLVVGIDPNGPARRAGIRLGDVLLAVSEQPVVDTASLRKALSQGVSGGRVQITLLRDGKPASLDIELSKAA